MGMHSDQIELRPRFMNLGSPRSCIPLPLPKPSLHFKFVREHAIGSHTTWHYVGYVALALLIGISVASFVTESVFFVSERMFSHPAVAGLDNVKTETTRPISTEHLGSDDGAALVSGNTVVPPNQYRLANIDQFPHMSAQAYLVADVDTGEVIYERGDTLVAPIASVSKLMTAVIAHEKMKPDQMLIVSRDAYQTFGSEGELLNGEKIRVADLMYPLLIESSNDGAEVFADNYIKGGHDAFMLEMNKKAKELGMNDTYYDDPSGLSAKNVSSSDDLFKLAQYIQKNIPSIWDTTRVRQYAILNHHWTNKNAQLGFDSFLGGKNGFIDESKQTGVSLYNVDLAKGGKHNLVIVLLRSNDRTGDVVRILNFIKKNGYYSPTVDVVGQ